MRRGDGLLDLDYVGGGNPTCEALAPVATLPSGMPRQRPFLNQPACCLRIPLGVNQLNSWNHLLAECWRRFRISGNSFFPPPARKISRQENFSVLLRQLTVIFRKMLSASGPL